MTARFVNVNVPVTRKAAKRLVTTRPQDRAIATLALAGVTLHGAQLDRTRGLLSALTDSNGVTGMVLIERDGRMRSLLPSAHPLRHLRAA